MSSDLKSNTKFSYIVHYEQMRCTDVKSLWKQNVSDLSFNFYSRSVLRSFIAYNYVFRSYGTRQQYYYFLWLVLTKETFEMENWQFSILYIISSVSSESRGIYKIQFLKICVKEENINYYFLINNQMSFPSFNARSKIFTIFIIY